MATFNIWNLYAPFYDQRLRPYEAMYQKMIRRIRKEVVGKDVLDVGCGTGKIASAIAVMSNHTVAIDLSRGMLKVAQKKPHPKNLIYRTGDARSLPFEKTSFDVVIVSQVLHVVEDPNVVFQEVKRVLKPKGKVILCNFLTEEKNPDALVQEWNEEEYLTMVKEFGWREVGHKVLHGKQNMIYMECLK